MTLRLRKLGGYAWALPATLVGLVLGGAAVLTGGEITIKDGVIECYGGILQWFLRRAVPLRGGASAMTVGHVVVGRDVESLRRTRVHERVHVVQYERWGPVFFLAYAAAAMFEAVRGRHYYHDNVFEREAVRVASRARSTESFDDTGHIG